MSLRFLYGRAGSGKTSRCLAEMKERLESGFAGRLILIVPEQYSLQAERSLIAAIGRKGIIGTEVLSFRRMAYRVFSEVGGLTFPHVDPSSKSMVLSTVIDQLKDQLKVFGKASGQKGFVGTLAAVVSEFKRYGVPSDELLRIASSEGGNELLKNKLQELYLIYTGYEAAIRDKFRDADDDLTLLAEKLERSEQFRGAEIWIDEFSGFTPQEYKVIAGLMNKAAGITISLCTDCLSEEREYASTEVFFPIQNAARKLTNLAREAEIEIKAPVVLSRKIPWRFETSPELAHLERNLNEFRGNRYMEKTQALSVFSSVSPYSEVEEAAREIVRLCRDEGCRFKDITVVSGNLETYGKLISTIFAEYGIPCFIDSKVRISVNPLVKMILAVFEVISGGWSYEAVFRYLKTGMTGIAAQEADRLENYVLACGVRGNLWIREEDWTFRTELSLDGEEGGADDERQKEELAEMNGIRRKVAGPLMNFKSRISGRKKAVDICTALYDLLCELGVPERIQQMTAAFRASGRLALAGEYNQVWNAVMGVLDSAVNVLGEEPVGLERFGELLELGFSECHIGLIPPSLDQVLVGSINRSKNHAVKILFVLGVNDGSFPSSGVEEGILSDNDREALRKEGLELSSDTRTKAFEEQYMVYSTLTTASEGLRLSYAIADHEGKTKRPSIMIPRLKRIFPELREYSNIVEDRSAGGMELVSRPAPTLEKLAAAMRKSAEGEEVGTVWQEARRWYAAREEWRRKYRNIVSALSYTNQTGYADTGKMARLYGNPVYSSVSRFEKYASCPFSYFIQYGLKAKERRIFSVTPPDVGTFLHTVIERFSGNVVRQGRSWRELEKDWCDSEISAIVDELLLNMRGSALNGNSRFTSLTRRLKRVLSRTIFLIVEHIKRGAFEPVGYEAVFGKDGDFPPITIELDSGEKVQLTGRVDRIDAFRTENGTYLRIVDYKSGSKAFKLSDVYYGIQVQLITYLDAIEQSGWDGVERPILPGGMLYMKIDDPLVRGGVGLPEEDIEKAIMRKMRMKGLVLADVRVIREMDRQIDGDSLVIPARINKGDVLGRSSAATGEQFELLRKYTRQLLKGMAEEMLKGDFSIKPYKKKNITSCMYCGYSAICQFDPLLKGNGYRILNDREDGEVWAALGVVRDEKADSQDGDA